MCKKAFLMIVALAWLVVPVHQALAAESGGDYYDLKAKIVELEKQLSNLGGLVKDLTFQVQENQALASIVKELSFQLKKNEGDVHSLTTLQDRIEQDVMPQIISIQSTVASLGSSLSEKIKALGVRVYDTESSIQQLSARIKANEDRLRALSGIENKVSELNERLYKVEQALQSGAAAGGADQAQALAELDKRVNSLSLQVQAQKGKLSALGDLDAQVQDLAAQVQQNADGLSGAQFALDGLRGRVATVESAQAGFATVDEVGELKSQLASVQEDLQKTRSATNTNFLIGVLGVLAGIGAMGLVLLGG